MQHFDYFGVSRVLTRISRKLPTLVCLLQAHKHIRKQHLWQAYRWWLGELVLPTCRWNHLTTEVSQVMLASVNRCACQSHLHFSYSRWSIFSDTGWGREMCWKEFLTNLCPRWQEGISSRRWLTGDVCTASPQLMLRSPQALLQYAAHRKTGEASNEQALAAGSNQSRGDWRSTRAFSNVFVFVFVFVFVLLFVHYICNGLYLCL